MNKTPVKTPTYVNAQGVIRVDFWSPDFDMLVDNKGYDAIWERAIPCPCGRRQNTNMSVCKNCQGTGWVFINPLQIKVVAQSINKDTKYKEWSKELLGTASFTVRSEYRLNYMDKIVLLNSASMESENRIVKAFQKRLFVNTIYPIDEVVEIFKFEGPNRPLRLLPASSYSVERSFVLFSPDAVVPEDSISISYLHKVQYNIIDLNHDVRNTIILDNQSRESDVVLPVSAIGRRTQFVLDASNYLGDNLFDNSYQQSSQC